MEVKIFFIALSVVCGLSAFLPYFIDIFRLKTKPHAYTWLIWTITQGTAVVGIFYGGGGWAGTELTIGTFLVFVIFLFSLKYGTKNITKSDTVVLVLAMFAILIWWQLKQPILSMIMVSAIDIAGYAHSLRKSFKDPWSETLISWILFALSDIFAIFALNQINFLTATYLASIGSANLILFFICYFRRRMRVMVRK